MSSTTQSPATGAMVQLRAATPAPGRSLERLRAQYEIERELAAQLRNASKQERRGLYSRVYDELFQRVPDHTQLTTKESPQAMARRVQLQMQLLAPFLRPDLRFAEIGPGDCSLTFHVARQVREAYGIDVSPEITKSATAPSNFTLLISDGTNIPVPPASIDLCYSNQLTEHLHPDDAHEQLENIFTALAPGGRYVCITPNRLNGPHDISRYFDPVATGFHLREYTAFELAQLFRRVGFRKLRVAIGGSTIRYWLVPVWVVSLVEHVASVCPARLRGKLFKTKAGRALLGVRLIGRKPAL